jgi:hypothetical protein
MNTTKITGADILRMCPGLKEAMSDVLGKCRESYTKKVSEDTNINTSTYKDSIKNAESPKKNSAK